MKKALFLSLAMLTLTCPIGAEEKTETHPCKKFARDKISMVKDALKLAPLTLLGAEWWHVCGLTFIEFYDSLAQHETRNHRNSKKSISTAINTLTNHWAQITAALAAGYLTQEDADNKFKVLGAALATVYGMNTAALLLNEFDKAAA